VTVVETSCGRVEGKEQGALRVFAGIPYARPPVGELRLRQPRPPEPWTGVRPALDFGPWAPQDSTPDGLTALKPGPRSEDCLTLNIWTPAGSGDRLPVMVWVHGGGFVGGSGSAPLYSGRALAEREVVVVTINYRLGALGFLAHPELADEGPLGAASGNWGLLDVVESLRWIAANIAAFGGDPANVTLFGESAGAIAICDVLAMPVARGLFHRAIAQSGPPLAASMDKASEVAVKLAAAAEVESPAALREVPLERLLVAQSSLLSQRHAGPLPLLPTVDGASLPRRPTAAAAVPLLIGTNRDEAKLFMIADPKNRDPDEEVLRRRIERAFTLGGIRLDPAAVIEAYRRAREARGEPTTPRELWSAIETDRMFRIGSLRAAAAHPAPAYCYLFCWESPAMKGALGACHALEIPFVFGTLDTPGMERFAGAGPEARWLSEVMMDYWLAFARSGEPAPAGRPRWPVYEAGGGAGGRSGSDRQTMVFGPGPSAVLRPAPAEEERLVWEGEETGLAAPA
jgi:para-nitrobenzyl esterase